MALSYILELAQNQTTGPSRSVLSTLTSSWSPQSQAKASHITSQLKFFS